MKKFIILIVFFFIINCTQKNTVYWCGDHQCLTKKEKEDYFKKTMIVEVRSDQLQSKEKLSKVEIIVDQANIKKDKSIISKNLQTNVDVDKKIIVKEQKKLIKEAKKLERQRIKEQKKQDRITKKLEREKLKDQKKIEKKTEEKLLADEKNIKKIQKSKNEKVAKKNDQLDQSSNFSYFVTSILDRNSKKDYPDVNSIPNLP